MNSRCACVIIGAICLFVGTGLGFFAARGAQSPLVVVSALPRTVPVHDAIVAPTISTEPAVEALRVDEDISNTELMRRRREAVRWLQQNGLYVNTLAFDFYSDRIGESFAQLFELTPEEEARLLLAVSRTKEHMAETEAQVAVSEMSADGTQLIVKVPPIPEAGGVVYDEFLATVSSVLGPERMLLFDVLVRDNLENSSMRFGLGETVLTIDRTPTVLPNGQLKIYKLISKTTGPDGNTSTGNNQATIQHAVKIFPVLRRVLPADMLSEAGSR